MSTNMAVLIPTRGRRENAERLVRAWMRTSAQADLCFCVDTDDAETYEGMLVPTNAAVYATERLGSMGEILNFWADRLAPMYEIIGFMGDDHLPRTVLWDQIVRQTLAEPPAMCYGDDCLQGALLPTSIFMTSDIIEELGYMAPPAVGHLFLDNVWLEWGRGLGKLYYREDLVIEHLHPTADKAKWDEGYWRVNSDDAWSRAELAYAVYRNHELQGDIDKLRSLL